MTIENNFRFLYLEPSKKALFEEYHIISHLISNTMKIHTLSYLVDFFVDNNSNFKYCGLFRLDHVSYK